MQRERVTEDIYVFTSDLYASVTAGLIVTDDGAALIDTLVPEETRLIKRFVEDRLGLNVRYVVNTHFHADHSTGTYLFPEAQVIGHRKCRDLLERRGRDSLEQMKEGSADLHDIELVLPDVVFDTSLTLHLGGKTLQLWSTPGHSPDSIVCLVEEDQTLFAADTLMPIPFFIDGDYHDLLKSLRGLQTRSYETIIQGHGEVILRGEVREKLQSDIDYLVKLGDAIDLAIQNQTGKIPPDSIKIEKCGKSRIALNGMAEQLHQQNVKWLIDRWSVEHSVEFPQEA
jgi:glyoxylase-like metal-dependent hydrolase (beta-lactamase superfamily II)